MNAVEMKSETIVIKNIEFIFFKLIFAKFIELSLFIVSTVPNKIEKLKAIGRRKI